MNRASETCCNNDKRSSNRNIRVPKAQEREGGADRVFKRTMADKFPNLVKDINLTDSRNKLNKIPTETHHN